MAESVRNGEVATFEVKLTHVVNERDARIYHSLTIATFEELKTSSQRWLPQSARTRAISFAKQIDKGFAVEVVEVANEDDREKAFGLIYHRDAKV